MAKTWRERDDQIMLEFKTGDGKSFFPEYVKPSFSIDMNTVALEFNNLDGAKCVRGHIGYREFEIKFFYQGDNHLEMQEELLKSLTEDRRDCIINHPYYGKIVGQPAGKLKVDNEGLNVSAITFVFYESILSDTPQTRDNVTEAISVISPEITVNIEKPEKFARIKKIFAAVAKVMAATSDILNAIISAEQQLDRYLNTIGTNAQRFMAQIAYIARMPGKMYDTVKNRINAIKDGYNDMKNAIFGLTNIVSYNKANKADKQLFEASGSYAVQSMVLAVTTSKLQAGKDLGILNPEPEPEPTTDEVKFQIAELAALYSDYVATLGNMQSEKDNKLDSYYPNYEAVISLQAYVLSAINSLYKKLSGASLEVVYVVPKDIGLKPLVFALVGDCSDEICIKFAQRNKLSSDELVLIPAGREVSYVR